MAGSLLIGIIFGSLEGHLNRDGTSRPSRHLITDASITAMVANGDLTQPAVDLLGARITLQTASAILITGFLAAYTTFVRLQSADRPVIQSGQILNAVMTSLDRSA